MNPQIQNAQETALALVVLEYIKALVWPVLVAGCLILYKKHIDRFLSKIKKAKIGDIEVEISEGEKIAVEVAKQEPQYQKDDKPRIAPTEANKRMIELGLEPVPSGLDMEYFRQLLTQNVLLCLAAMRIELEILGKNLLRGWDIPMQRPLGAMSIYRELSKHNAITDNQFELASIVLRICNRAVHGEEITSDEAERILEIADVLMKQYIDWLSWGFKKF